MSPLRLPPSWKISAGEINLPGYWRRHRGLAIAGGVLLLLLGLVLGLALLGEGKRSLPPPPVRVGLVERKDVDVQERTIGTVVANATVQITARVAGQIDSAAFIEGQIVHRGDILFRLDPRPFQAAVEQAEGTLARDEAQLVSAQQDATRFDDLARQGAASAQQRDQAVAAAKALAATVKADHAAVDLARLSLQYSVIASPITGKTGPILVQPGNLVEANGTSPLVVITQIQPVKVSFFLPQSDLAQIQAQLRSHRLTVNLSAHGDTQASVKAEVDFIGNAVDARTGTIELRASFANSDGRFVPGQLLDVAVSVRHLEKAIVVPREAVNAGPGGNYIFVVDRDHIARMQPVSVLYDDGTRAAVSGKIKAGEEVITDGQLRVMPGRPVAIVGGTGKHKSR